MQGAFRVSITRFRRGYAEGEVREMYGIDRKFWALANEVQALSQMELYHRIRCSLDRVSPEIQKSCMDFFQQFPYWGRLDIPNGEFQFIAWKARALAEHIGDFAWFYERLEDYRSKATLYSILNNWYRWDFQATSRTRETLFDDYFDLDVVKCSPEEVLVDLGAYIGDTVLSYLRNYGTDCYRRIYCYEITPQHMPTLEKNLSGFPNIVLRHKGVSDREGSMALSPHAENSSGNTLAETGETQIPVTTLDADIDETVTLIKADIEGFEQRALLGAAGHIRASRPKLLISVYHSNDDLWQIPQMIHGFYPDYRFYLRYNSSPIYPTEITLLAI